ncbi:hypothetical protein FRC20_001262 [Serendipita sp. 405]|nr:hypothetical protein FRC18_001421 [Serendipita sp. 400]KAG8853337.1 hypothetical protein FRC20_001262 [Serendipita sp. 405]
MLRNCRWLPDLLIWIAARSTNKCNGIPLGAHIHESTLISLPIFTFAVLWHNTRSNP